MHIAIAREDVYAALDSDAGRASFWAESAREEGGVIRFRFPDGSEHDGRIVERRPPGAFAVEYFGGIARFELTDDGKGGTDLLLTHDGVAAEEWNEVHAGWLNVLFPLKARLAHRIDLRNHDRDRSWDRGYADQ
jgi:uncharacterized protein YndB with AHSA1/START domain